jgi:hypothetical protein
MRTYAVAALLFSSAYAAPWGKWGLWGNHQDPTTCLNQQNAQYLVDGFGKLISAFTLADADRLLANDLVDYSDSILALQGKPLGGPLFPNKAAFEAGQGAQPPVPFQVLALEAFNCDTIAFRWQALLPGSPAKGMTVLKASNYQRQANTWQISTIFTEFNSITWGTDVGAKYTPPPPPPGH